MNQISFTQCQQVSGGLSEVTSALEEIKPLLEMIDESMGKDGPCIPSDYSDFLHTYGNTFVLLGSIMVMVAKQFSCKS